MKIPSERDDNLRQFASPTQWRYIETYWSTGCSTHKAAKVLGKNQAGVYRTIQTLLRNAVAQGYAPEYGMPYEIPDGLKLSGVSIYRQATEDTPAQWIKAKADRERQLELVKEAFEAFVEELPRLKAPKASVKKFDSDLLKVIPFGDPHFGLHCWHEEVGNDFDLKIAKRELCAAVRYLVEQGPPAERCLIANLGDFFHADNLEGTTVRSGHVLDMDTRLPKMVRIGVAAMRQAIETALTRHKTVEVINAVGNHDEVLSMALSILLANVYENESRVVIHDAPTWRHYIQHGKVLIGITHGDKTKDQDLPGIMATERPAEWGDTKFRYYYRGHHHHDRRVEYNGCVVEQFQTLAPGDAYAVKHGYLSGQGMKAIVHHKDFGECERYFFTLDRLKSIK